MAKSYYYSNKEVAVILNNVASAYKVKKENRFKIAAYEQAASAIEHLSSEIRDLWEEGKLDQVPGIGPSIASHLEELFTKGESAHFNKVFSGLPESMFVFLSIPGVGPKKAYMLAKELNIDRKSTALAKLKKAGENKQIRQIEGFGEGSEKEILKRLGEYKRKEKRMSLFEACNQAEKLRNYLKSCEKAVKVEVLGSLRRRCVSVGDIDIVAATNEAQAVIHYFTSYPKKRKIINAGPSKASILLTNNFQADLRVIDPKSWGSMLQYFTGSKQHNISLREYALKKGMSLSEYGIKKVKSQKLKIKNYSKEKDFYNALGMEWIPPELREDTGEIDAAIKKELPKLVKLKEIKGDLHMHSNFNTETGGDLGINSVKEMCEKALKFGYQYIAFTEHNPSMSKHSEQQITGLIMKKKKYIEHIKSSSKKLSNLHIFNSLEVNILPDGQLAISDKALHTLDFAIASIHSSFLMPKEAMTARILKGLDHPKVKILGHPTNRMIGSRKGIEADWEKIFDFCAKNKKILEVNANPKRLDLPDNLIKKALTKGVKLAINSDAHAADSMNFMKFGVWNARRGWAEAKDIINTMNYDKINKILCPGAPDSE